MALGRRASVRSRPAGKGPARARSRQGRPPKRRGRAARRPAQARFRRSGPRSRSRGRQDPSGPRARPDRLPRCRSCCCCCSASLVGQPVVPGLPRAAASASWSRPSCSAGACRRRRTRQVEGQIGAAAAVLQNMRGDWRVTPAVGFTREQDLVHRVLGKPGDRPRRRGRAAAAPAASSATKKRRVPVRRRRPVYDVVVGDGEGEVPLRGLEKHFLKLPHNIKPKVVNELDRKFKAMGGRRCRSPRGRCRAAGGAARQGPLSRQRLAAHGAHDERAGRLVVQAAAVAVHDERGDEQEQQRRAERGRQEAGRVAVPARPSRHDAEAEQPHAERLARAAAARRGRPRSSTATGPRLAERCAVSSVAHREEQPRDEAGQRRRRGRRPRRASRSSRPRRALGRQARAAAAPAVVGPGVEPAAAGRTARCRSTSPCVRRYARGGPAPRPVGGRRA